ncbi:MAG TPA: RNA pseudouridine synthase [Pseudolabrys sp.]|nr:RNA pseudouridine synthase [Pseudolabrys sp.]
MTPEEMQARLLYRDGLMLVIDKPPGLPVHRGPKGVEAFEDYFDALRFGLPRPPALAHRLDRDTTGCLVLGRHRKALALLGKLFQQGKVGKTYWAVVEGGPAADTGMIDIALAKRDESRGWWMKADPQGLPSVTRWTVMGQSSMPQSFVSRPPCGEGAGMGVAVDARANSINNPPPQPSPTREEGTLIARGSASANFTWLALEPLTGRTHQLRVHCAEMGFPIVGDTIYGSASRHSVSLGGPALHLHAREVVVPISKNKPPVTVTAPLPTHMRELLGQCGWKGE